MLTLEPFVACSNCFINEGLRLDADRLGEDDASPCPRCEAIDGRKLGSDRLAILANDFFVWGSVHRLDYGAAPRIQFNDRRETDMDLPASLRSDVAVFEETLGIGFFLYGPRLWMLGEVEPLKALQCDETRPDAIDQILREYGSRTLSVGDKFYRIRKNPDEPWEGHQYDSPPPGLSDGRLNTAERPVLYASPDLQTCLHECRVTAEDDLYMATLRPAGEPGAAGRGGPVGGVKGSDRIREPGSHDHHAVPGRETLVSDCERNLARGAVGRLRRNRLSVPTSACCATA